MLAGLLASNATKMPILPNSSNLKSSKILVTLAYLFQNFKMSLFTH